MTFLTEEECRAAVQEALDSLPPQFAEKLQNVAVIVDDGPPNGLYGLYDPRGGIPRIVIYSRSNPSAEQVRRTVLHEVGHHFGMSEEQIRGLGYG
jgi:predicted Zn-dependent protease with MMP-like domain